MRCRHCNTALAPLRSLADGEFCCDEHRAAFCQKKDAAPEGSEPPLEQDPAEPEVSAAVQILRLRFAPAPQPAAPAPQQAAADAIVPEPAPAPPAPQPVAAHSIAPELAPEPPAPQPATAYAIVPEPAPAPPAPQPATAYSIAPELVRAPQPAPFEPVLAQSIETPEELPATEFEPEAVYESEESYEAELDPELAEPVRSHPAREVAASWKWIRTAWATAPRDLKLVTVVLPILAALAVTGSFPKVPVKAVAPAQVAQVEKAVNEQWKNFTQQVSNRAAVSFADDFRSGLDAWQSRANLTTSWSYDVAGFVHPGPLALFKPTIEMSDYRFEFLGEIDQKALGWVFRAEDLKNYYAVKLVVVKPGPLPLVDLVRYAVIDGKEGPVVHKPLPITVRADMLYRVLVDVRGPDFTVMAQGQVVDFWTDHRLQHGGVGFFANHGERARLRWVEVSHQYDALGRVCAYLAPYGIEGRNGSFN